MAAVKPGGFTLVEVLVALAIIGLALPALLFYVGGIADTSTYLREKTIAQWVASNRYAEAAIVRQLKGQVLQGTSTGRVEMASGEWHWQMEGRESNFDGIQELEINIFRAEKKALTGEELPLVNFVALIEQ